MNSGSQMRERQHFLERFKAFSEKEKLIHPDDRILVAVSGGADSMVLLASLVALAPVLKLELVVAHLNHCLRESASDKDEDFVMSVAQVLDLPFVSEKKDIAAMSKSEKLSLETAGRKARYHFLERQREKTGSSKIATGHHAGDQAETVLMNLIRGSGFRGLSGIPARRGNIIRPLLFASRDEILQFASINEVAYRQDSSNQTTEFKRNRVRHELIPLLERQFNMQVFNRLNAFSQVCREGDEFLRFEARKALKNCLLEQKPGKLTLDIGRFCSYFTILQKYVLFEAFELAGIVGAVQNFNQINGILESIVKRRSGSSHHFSPGWTIGVEHSGIVIRRRSEQLPLICPLKIGETVSVPGYGYRFLAEWHISGTVDHKADPDTELVDAGKIDVNSLKIRSVQAGDWFFPLGMSHRQKLSDFLINQKVPVHARSEAVVLTSRDDIVWLCGYRLDHRFRIRPGTRQTLKLKMEYG